MAEKSEIWYLEEVDLFDILCSRKTPRMETEHPPNQYGKDEYIYFPDQESTSIYMIANGRVKIGSYLDDGKEIVKAILGKGEVLESWRWRERIEGQISPKRWMQIHVFALWILKTFRK